MEIISVLVLLVGIFCVVFLPFCFVFKKAGINAWVAFVPFYNGYMLGKVAKDEALGVIYIAITVFGSIFSKIVGEESALSGIAIIAMYICSCVVYVNLGRRFEASLGFKIALCLPLIGWIMCWVLGLDEKYVYHKFNQELSN